MIWAHIFGVANFVQSLLRVKDIAVVTAVVVESFTTSLVVNGLDILKSKEFLSVIFYIS